MSKVFAMEKIRREKGDASLQALIYLLVGLGIVMLFSASYYPGMRIHEDPFYFVVRQLIWVAMGTAAAWVLSRMNLDLLRQAAPWLLLVSAVLMLLTFVPFLSKPLLGARRWLFLFGQTFQPSELVKFSLTVYLAMIFSRRDGKMHDIVNTLLPPFMVVMFFIFLVLLQNDYSTAMFILFVCLAMFFVAEVKFRYLLVVLGGSALLGVLALFSKAYRIERVLTFLDPERDPSGSGYQILAAKKALVEGGLFGSGLGGGQRKLGSLPEVQSDFILGVIGEETGLIGITVLFVLFGLLLWKGYRTAASQPQRFGYFLGFGISSFIFYQFLVNSAVVAGAIPATGVTLPFFSAGGSSILVTLMMMGLLVNLSRQTQKEGPLVR